MDQVNILPQKPLGDVKLVLSWEFSATQNRALFMQRLATWLFLFSPHLQLFTGKLTVHIVRSL